MQFPDADQLRLPCTFEQVVPGQLHPDGRRYLPLIVLRLPNHAVAGRPGVTSLAVVDRHHVVDEALVGRRGVARLVFLLSTVSLQNPPRQGLSDEDGRGSTVPVAYGRVAAVPTWEIEREHLPYESLYAELLLDIGVGVVGVRTSTSAASLAESIGKAQIVPGDWLRIARSRVDILAFE